jgi:quercetin dioxygenase-like cupin family protein
MQIETGNLKEKFEQIKEYWDPHVVTSLNGQEVKLARFKGQFPPHKHDHEDEMFLVFRGEIEIEMQGRAYKVREGEFITIPRGVTHAPSAKDDAWVILFEPARTINTGDQKNDFTKKELKNI